MSANAVTAPPVLKATNETIRRAAESLRAGRLVVFPTETVYGLGGDATNGDAVAAIFAAKKRPSFNPLISHFSDMENAMIHGYFGELAIRLASAFWPGPLTLVVPKAKNSNIAQLTTAGLKTVAIRVPAHPVAQALLKEVGLPLAAPSANVSGRISPTRAEHVAGLSGDFVDMVLDGGPCDIGLESTIVFCTEGAVTLLRPGGISPDDLEEALGQKIALSSQIEDTDTPQSPGQLKSHYAPNNPLRLNVRQVLPGEGLLAFGKEMPVSSDKAAFTLNLSPTGNLHEAAANLFDHLLQLDARNISGIAVLPIPEAGLGIAINDRLRRAAAPRD